MPIITSPLPTSHCSFPWGCKPLPPGLSGKDKKDPYESSFLNQHTEHKLQQSRSNDIFIKLLHITSGLRLRGSLGDWPGPLSPTSLLHEKAVFGNRMMHKRGKIYLYEESSFHVDGKQKSFGVIAELWDKQGKEE